MLDRENHPSMDGLKKLLTFKSKQIAFYMQCVLAFSLVVLALVLMAFLVKETWHLVYIFFSETEKKASYLLIESIVVWFLYFEFIALIIKYFESNYHFPLNYFIYIGITAIIRLIIIDHKTSSNTLIYSAAILFLLLALYLANTRLLKRS